MWKRWVARRRRKKKKKIQDPAPLCWQGKKKKLETIADTFGIPCRQEWRFLGRKQAYAYAWSKCQWYVICHIWCLFGKNDILNNMRPYVPGWILNNHKIFAWGQGSGIIGVSSTFSRCPHFEINDLSWSSWFSLSLRIWSHFYSQILNQGRL